MVRNETHSAASPAPCAFTRLGVTGGIAAGKSTVLGMFQKLGATTMDADYIAHTVLEPGNPAWQAVVDAFGSDILLPTEAIDRKKLGEIVFGDESKRLLLNRLVHPAVRAHWLGEIDALAQRGFTGVVAVGIPLLYETDAQTYFDSIVAVGCTETTLTRRLINRGFTETQARQRIAAQMPTTEKMERADFVIWSEVPLAIVEQQVHSIWKWLPRR